MTAPPLLRPLPDVRGAGQARGKRADIPAPRTQGRNADQMARGEVGMVN